MTLYEKSINLHLQIQGDVKVLRSIRNLEVKNHMIIALFDSQQYTLYKEINSFLKIGFPSVKIELNIQVDHIYKCNLRAQRRFQFEG